MRQMTPEQSPQTRGSSTERAQTGHQSLMGCGRGVCGGLGEDEDILSLRLALLIEIERAS
jgi:hypothetical protein